MYLLKYCVQITFSSSDITEKIEIVYKLKLITVIF